MPTWLIIGLAVEAFSIVAAIALCKAAARGDNRMEIEPSPLIREIDAWRSAMARTYHRQGITPLETHGRARLGIDVDHERGAAVQQHPAP
jgi:hypothetical protein